MKKLEVGKAQIKVMRILWEKKRATAQEITDEIKKTEPVKHSSVQTFLRILVKKGVVGFETDKRTFVYFPLVNEDQIKNHAVNDLIEHVFEGSLEGFVSFMVKRDYISPEEIKKIYEVIDKKGK